MGIVDEKTLNCFLGSPHRHSPIMATQDADLQPGSCRHEIFAPSRQKSASIHENPCEKVTKSRFSHGPRGLQRGTLF